MANEPADDLEKPPPSRACADHGMNEARKTMAPPRSQDFDGVLTGPPPEMRFSAAHTRNCATLPYDVRRRFRDALEPRLLARTPDADHEDDSAHEPRQVARRV